MFFLLEIIIKVGAGIIGMERQSQSPRYVQFESIE